MQNKLIDLNNLLFEQIERINDDELDDDDLKIQLNKAKHINDVAKTIVDINRLAFDALKHGDSTGRLVPKALSMED